MKLIYVVAGSVIAVLALFALMLNRNYSNFAITSITMNPGPQAKPQDSPDTPIIVVNEIDRRACQLGSGGMSGYYNDNLLEKAEQLFRQRHFKEAISVFSVVLTSNSSNLRAQLGIGKSLVELHQYEKAITHLSIVRNECHRHRCAAETVVEPYDLSTNIEYLTSDLDLLPKQAREALDYEARMALEKAVLSLPKKSNLKDCAHSDYKNEHHYLVLKSCLSLVRDYHARSKRSELAAMFILANENTRNLPLDLITDLTVNGTVEEKWSQLARLTLNASVPEERDWYETQLSGVGELLPDKDIRKAASYHFHGVCDVKEHAGAWETEKAAKILGSLNIPLDVFRANCNYDHGRIAYLNGSNAEAITSFQKAVHTYVLLDRQVDVADTEFNIGCANYKLGDLNLAKLNFISAARFYRGDRAHKENERLASYNAAALSVDGEVTYEDEVFLREYHSRFQSKESATMLALYLFKQNRFEASLEPFRFAANEYFSKNGARQPYPHQALIGVVDTKSDRKLTDEQVLQELFARTDRIDEYVNTRWSPTDRLDNTYGMGERELTRARIHHYSNLVMTLYSRALERSGKLKELAEFETLLQDKGYQWASTKKHYNEPYTAEVIYLNLLENTFKNYWYCPIHTSLDQTVVRLKIDKHGNVTIVSSAKINPAPQAAIERKSLERQITLSILDETLTWSSQMPKPPAGIVDKELIVLFNAQAPDRTYYGMPVMLPASTSSSSAW